MISLTSQTDFRFRSYKNKSTKSTGCSKTTLTFLWWQMVTDNCQTKCYELTQNPGAILFSLIGWTLL